MRKAKVYDNTKTGEPIKELKVNSNWFQKNKKKIAGGTIVLALCFFGFYQCSTDDKERISTCPSVTDKIVDEDETTKEKDGDEATDEVEKDKKEKTTGVVDTNRNNQTSHSNGNKQDSNSDDENKKDNTSSNDDKKPDTKPDTKPDPKPDPTPDPKPDPEPERPAEEDRESIKDDEDRQPNIGGNEGDFVLEAYDEVEEKQSETSLYRSDIPHMEEQEMPNYSVRIEYLEGLKAELEQIATEEVSFTR